MRAKVVSIIALLIGIVVLGYAVSNQMEIQKLKKYGIEVQAVPTGELKEVRTRRRTSYRAEFRFETQSGQTVTAFVEVTEDLRSKLRNREPIHIKYLESDPRETARIVGNESEGSYMFWVLGAIMLGYGVYGIRTGRNS
jgi:hypothetical protein